MYEQSEHIGEIVKALLAVQKVLPIAAKDSVNPFAKNRYASLNSIMECCHRPLLENGILVLQCPVAVAEPGSLGLMTRLIHVESGQWVASVAVIPMSKADPQGMGAAITYARRYALSAMLGIVAGDDNDGEDVSFPRQTQSRPVSVPKQQAAKPERTQETPLDENPPYYDDPFTGGVSSYEPPKLPGIQYARRDGRIIASGETVKNKEALKGAGFKWNPNDRVWVKSEASARQAAYA